MTQSADVFISYSREDKDRVLELAAQLRSAGVSIWIDQGGIDCAAMWGEAIVNAIEKAKVMLLMVTEASVRSHNVAKEVVLTSERKGHILPVLLEPTSIPPSLKYPLAGIQQIEYFQGPPDEGLKAILRSLEKLGVNVAPSRPSAATTRYTGCFFLPNLVRRILPAMRHLFFFILRPGRGNPGSEPRPSATAFISRCDSPNC